MSERSTVKFTVPVSLMYDNTRSSEADAVEDFFRAMAEAEQAGFFDRTIISIDYGGPDNISSGGKK